MAKSKWELFDIGSKLDLIEGWARAGLTEIDMCKNLSIGKTTFNKIKREHPELRERLKNGKQIADVIVENALYKRAIGYECEETMKEVVVDPKTGEAKPVSIKTTKKSVAPDTIAQIFWLKNRNPERWKDRNETDITTNGKEVRVILPRGDGD